MFSLVRILFFTSQYFFQKKNKYRVYCVYFLRRSGILKIKFHYFDVFLFDIYLQQKEISYHKKWFISEILFRILVHSAKKKSNYLKKN